MSQEPKVTRFGADPTVDQELATKAYVDNSGGGGTSLFFSANFQSSTTANGLFFYMINADSADATEANRDAIIDHAMTTDRIRANVNINTKNGATILGWRDDGVTIDSISIAASTTGDFDSGQLSSVVATLSRVDIIIDTSGSSSGAISFTLLSTCLVN